VLTILRVTMGRRGLGLWGAASRPCGCGLDLSIKR